MPTCSPCYSVEDIPINEAACGETCQGVEYSVDSMTTAKTPEGSCYFKWKVIRNIVAEDGTILSSTTFADEAIVACPAMQEIIFYCDATKNCPVFKLILCCELPGDGEGSNGGNN